VELKPEDDLSASEDVAYGNNIDTVVPILVVFIDRGMVDMSRRPPTSPSGIETGE